MKKDLRYPHSQCVGEPISVMSRNMIKTHEAIFQPLIEVVEKSVNDLRKKRYIKLTEIGKNCLKNAEITEKYLVSPRVKAASIFLKEGEYTHHFFVIAGLENLTEMDAVDFFVIEENDSFYAPLLEIAISELKIPLITNLQPLAVINEIISDYMGIDDYDGHDINTVKSFFTPIELYKVENTYPTQQLERLVGLRLCKQPDNLVLPFSTDTLDLFNNLFLEGASAIPYDNLIQCCYSVSWKHAFLEVYRTVERLYPLPFLKELHSEIGLGNNFTLLELGEKVKDILGWKPIEEASAKKIIDGSPKNVINLLETVKNANPESLDTSTHKWFYNFRNSIVHFRLATQNINISDEHWDKLIRAILQIIENWYKRYKTELS